VRGVTALDPRSDIYCLGVVLYEAITGRLPFNATSEFEIMLAQVNGVPAAPSSINPAIPEELDRIILTALAKDPSKRFQTAEEFSSARAEAEEPDISRRPRAAPVPEAVAVRVDPTRGVEVPPAAATPERYQWLFREWTFAELALSGVITSLV